MRIAPRSPTSGAEGATERVSVIDALKFIALLMLGAVCTLAGLALLLSVGVAMPVLTEQASAWLAGSQWRPFPLAMALAQPGYGPEGDGTLIAGAIDWVLSVEVGVALVAAAGGYGCILWIFHRAVEAWGPARPVRRRSLGERARQGLRGLSFSTPSSAI